MLASRGYPTTLSCCEAKLPGVEGFKGQGKSNHEPCSEHISFILRRLECPALAKPGTSIPISMWWLNAGVAPIYKEYWLAVELQSVEICLLVPIVFVSPCSIKKPANP